MIILAKGKVLVECQTCQCVCVCLCVLSHVWLLATSWTIACRVPLSILIWYFIDGHTLKPNIQETKIMASGSITSRQIDGEKMERVSDFIFLGSKITVDGDCSHEIQRCFFLGRKAMTNLDSLLKSKGKGPYSQSYDFFSSHVQCENWTIKKAEHWRTHAF